MCVKRYPGKLRKSLLDESGSATIEFVILFPAILLLIAAIAFTSIYIATISDVQQVASELSRQSVRYVNLGYDGERICSELTEDILPLVTGSLAFVSSDRFTAPVCNLQGGVSQFLVSIDYNLSGTPLQRFGAVVGFDFQTISRQSSLIL